MTIEAHQLLAIARKVLNELGIYGYKDVELTYTEKVDTEWKANFAFTRSDSWAKSTGCFSADVETGEVIFSAVDKVWKFWK